MTFTLGLIGGSGLLKTKLAALSGLTEETVDTAHGRVFLRTGNLNCTDGSVKLVFIQRHDARPTRVYTQPADINYPALALVLKAKGCNVVVGICSVGSLKSPIGVGALMVCDDFWCPADLRRVYSDFRGHLMPGFDSTLRESMLSILRAAGHHPLPMGVYGNARGPRFETKSEIRMMADYCDVVGMTGAHECAACCEVQLPYAMLCCIDNYANGIGQEALTLDAFHSAQAANLITVENCVAALLKELPNRPELPRTLASMTDAVVGAGGSSSSGAAATPTTKPEHVDLIVYARWIVTMAPSREQEVLDKHAIVVHNGLIHDILPANSAEITKLYAATKVVDLSDDHVLIPGLVNAHTHLALTLLRGVADDMPLAQWLTEHIWPIEGRVVAPDFVKTGTRAAVAELFRGGVTCVNEMYWFPESVAEGLEETGMRGLVAMVVLEFPSAYAKNADEYIANGLAVREKWMQNKQKSQRVTFGFGPHAPYTVGDSSFAKIKEQSEALNCPVHIHLHETSGEVLASRTGGKEGTSKHLSDQLTSPFENLDRLGLINERLVAVHMTALEEAQIQRLAEAKASVVHCPTSNLKLASGFCPVSKLLQAGVNVAIGTDSASSNNSLDMWAEIKLSAILAKGVSGDATSVPAWQALKMATYNGAKALGLADVIGSLEVGKQADMVAVKLSGHVETGPIYSILSHLVYATNRHAVSDVWVQGQQVLVNRHLTTIDEHSLLKELKTWAETVRPGATVDDRNVMISPEFTRAVMCCGGSAVAGNSSSRSSSGNNSKSVAGAGGGH